MNNKLERCPTCGKLMDRYMNGIYCSFKCADIASGKPHPISIREVLEGKR